MSGVDVDRALEVAREAAAAAIEILVEARERTGRAEASEKNPRDLVTEADHAAERAIVEVLSGAFPDHGVLAEESDGRSGSGNLRWVIDPLDGTANYVHDFPVWAVSVALFDGDEPLVGLVVDPVRDEWFSAIAGRGARVDPGDPDRGRAMAVSGETTPGAAIVATGFPFRSPDQIDRYLGAFRTLFEEVSDMRRAGSAALDLAWTAAGRLDGFWEIGLNLWDIAAGELLVEEAGGRVTGWEGGEGHRASGTIAAGTPAVHALLVATLEEWA
ncbi:MAG: inositol monophosphatase family protein [Gemmatimonadota bacterium]|nr:inositol monophosphatase family protein [Gemmatimonadota bacterium]